MTEDSASTSEDGARMEAAVAWFYRIEMADDPLGTDELEAFELWQADSPDNGRAFNTVKDEMRAFDNPLFRFMVKERIAALAAKSDAKD